ncbi:PAS domain-containing methyl-accepting chemotaxis protein [Agrobacterium tumefaciens]|uniref:PAS domain S-box protein n=1 Tax=Agrobacterium tumefaciens TaxID=358 RepID=A0AA44F5L5_AGRTU|nr:PAS domain-containing methyl-accepting chemotaxis protein [Agrobacterium tumefaciens]NTB87642.1 PAS domain S-box protein [Agrobacterium tumefaciens]NTC19990.1 PAS domain S-box protein [Agrobacterium tumefaciens]NTC29809.1 PAS domain S-box protein [Agrobacterium tumefaciens]
MLGYKSGSARVLEALSKSLAIIEFGMDGKILSANDTFCRALGYRPEEIVGQHHRLFVDPIEAATPEYAEFWARLNRGEFDRSQYKRIGKGGREVWIEATYNPIMRSGKPYKVVKFASDITAAKLKSAEDAGKLAALSRSQAVIEFQPNGDILTANENFLSALGYSSKEIEGGHHSMFCDADYVKSEEYRRFWERLRGGEFITEEFMRIGKDGRKVFIQASYNPILDTSSRVFKVVKFATDVTQRVENVNSLAAGLNAMSSGDLTADISKQFIPSLECLRTDFNTTLEKLRMALGKVSENARTISESSSEIREASDDLAKRTEQQAASIEETAAALEEITTTVIDSSRRGTEAGRLVARTKENAQQSGQIVCKAIAAMGEIERSSREITNIIGVIDEIAFQTNLLALNAGVEAARAGESGKGFAVVAQEVRELAQRSANAAKEIKALIRISANQVASGVDLVGQTGAALQEIFSQVEEIDSNVGAIVEGGNEQALGLKEINIAVNTMDQGTQKNAAMVEETNAAAHGLAAEAQALFNLISQFKLSAADARQHTATHSRPWPPVSRAARIARHHA